MLKRTLTLSLAAFAAVLVASADASAQDNPRFGVWKLRSDAPPPQVNIMTYEPYMDGGMRITVASTNARGQESKWGYVTLFDGVFRPVTGREGSETAVEIINQRTTRISNKRNGRVSQIIINTLSEDGNTINNEYVRLDENGDIVRVTHAVYERIG
ncbi:MAG: hypothetical protein IIA55_12955 [Gemmatimonadetes bacterium]|nr:hypothetical protein [Gemmatimonadota bacterium]